MTNEEITRNIRNLAKKHENDTIHTFGVDYHLAFTEIANHIEEQEKENEHLKEKLSHSIDIACEGCPKDNLSECMQEHCIRWIAKNHRDTLKNTIKDYYIED